MVSLFEAHQATPSALTFESSWVETSWYEESGESGGIGEIGESGGNARLEAFGPLTLLWLASR